MTDQKQQKNVESFKYLGSILTNNEDVLVKLNPGKAAFNKKRALFTSKMDLELRKKLVKCYIWNTASYGAET
jgi:hypothetical protein